MRNVERDNGWRAAPTRKGHTERKETYLPVFVDFKGGEHGEERRRSLFPKGREQVVAIELLNKGTVRRQGRSRFIKELKTT